jgi:hypothetical protein
MLEALLSNELEGSDVKRSRCRDPKLCGERLQVGLTRGFAQGVRRKEGILGSREVIAHLLRRRIDIGWWRGVRILWGYAWHGALLS